MVNSRLWEGVEDFVYDKVIPRMKDDKGLFQGGGAGWKPRRPFGRLRDFLGGSRFFTDKNIGRAEDHDEQLLGYQRDMERGDVPTHAGINAYNYDKYGAANPGLLGKYFEGVDNSFNALFRKFGAHAPHTGGKYTPILGSGAANAPEIHPYSEDYRYSGELSDGSGEIINRDAQGYQIPNVSYDPRMEPDYYEGDNYDPRMDPAYEYIGESAEPYHPSTPRSASPGLVGGLMKWGNRNFQSREDQPPFGGAGQRMMENQGPGSERRGGELRWDTHPSEDPRMMAPYDKGPSNKHFQSNKGGPVDARFEPNYDLEYEYQQKPLGGMDRLPTTRDYAGGSGGGYY